MESRQSYKVFIQGIGIKLVSACTRDHARQVAYASFCHLEDDVSKYSTMLKSLVA